MNTTSLECLFLSEDDLIKLGVLDMKQCIAVMEETFRLVGIGDYLMGGPSENEHGQKLYFPLEERFPNMPKSTAERRFMSMIAYLGGDFNVCGMKWYGSNVQNSKKKLPRSILMTVLNDPDTGAPLAIMSGNTISAMRTGAMPGLGAKYLANPESKVLGIVGAGVVGKTSLLSLAQTLPNIEEVKVYDILEEKTKEFTAEMSKRLRLKVRAVSSIDEAIIDSDVINVAASRTHKPTIKSEWLKEGSMLSLPAAVNLEEDILLNSTVVVDEWKMHLAHKQESMELPEGDPRKFDLATSFLFDLIEEGKLNEESIQSLGPIISGDQTGRALKNEKTVFITGGLPVQDVAWSHYLYNKAKQENIGKKLKFWNQPYLF
jgi:N-[(2S)-2-amino-2-carboxyethyl]-L-glutamate dehydrogenase